MSYTELYGFDKNGDAYFQAEVPNSWRGAVAIWGIMEKKYLPPYIPNYVKSTNWYFNGISFDEVTCKLGYAPSRICSMFESNNPIKEIWDLVDNERVPQIEKIVLMTTFDKVLVKKENMPKVIEGFIKFDGESSLKEQAAILQKMYKDENCIAVGWNQTSVNADNWGSFNYNEETGYGEPYNCLTQNEHFWLFDELET